MKPFYAEQDRQAKAAFRRVQYSIKFRASSFPYREVAVLEESVSMISLM